MGKGFALKLALNNIKLNRKFYLPYILAGIGMIMMFYIMCFLGFNKGIQQMAGAQSLSVIMFLGSIVIGIFATIFLFYTNGFLMKRRKKEIGLYNILGMEKKHIGKILFIENVITSVVAIVVGLICGLLFSRFVFLLLCKMINLPSPIDSGISKTGIVASIILFSAIYLVSSLFNQMKIHLASPIELLRGGEVGEREPKTKVLLSILGIVCLGIGYYIAITTKSPLTAVFLFFVAVILVIIGTYCLFISVSIAVLKALKKNKKFYYKSRHFTAVSGMIYRMKQNAVGLANICILSTMVLVMVSSTVCLYIGSNDIINTMYPGDITVNISGQGTNSIDEKVVTDTVKKAAKDKGLETFNMKGYHSLSFAGMAHGKNYKISNEYDNSSMSNVAQFTVLTVDGYNKLTGSKEKLSGNQTILAYEGDRPSDEFSIGNYQVTIVKEVQPFIKDTYISGLSSNIYLVVADDKAVNKLYDMQRKAYGDNASHLSYFMSTDLSGSDAEKIEASALIERELSNCGLSYEYIRTGCKADTKGAYDSLIGGFFFLGVFLGLVFTFAAALIIYYKQISEGYYDKDKFEIMQKVGMSKGEVKKAIRTQVLMVFFAPLLVAGIHVLAAFNLIKRLLSLFALSNVPLFIICTACTFLVFAAIYGIVYSVTAREYYKIVQ